MILTGHRLLIFAGARRRSPTKPRNTPGRTVSLGSDDRLLLGRAIIRRVVGDHVRSLHRSGAELWSPAQEEAYVTAVENAVFGYGRLQPLLEMPDVENIEIHGWNSVVVQYGDGRREQMPPVADSDAELIEAIRFWPEQRALASVRRHPSHDDLGSRRAIPLARHGIRIVLPPEHRDPSAPSPTCPWPISPTVD